MEDGKIGLNAIHRRHASVSNNLFIPPDDFNLTMLTLELEFWKKGTKEEYVLTIGQKVMLEYQGTKYVFIVNEAAICEQAESYDIENRGMLSAETYILFTTPNSSGIKITNQRGGASSTLFKHKEFNLQSLDLASSIGNAALWTSWYWKDSNGSPDWENVKWKEPQGDESNLHVIIFDEIDAICKSRGSTKDGTGVHDSIVNQLLTKIDGVKALNNVLLIGMTNRKDLLNEALFISLPDENGRLQIIQIHTNKMKESSFLAPDVDLQELAARSKNYSGAELEGVVKSAVSFALNRQLNLEDLSKPVDEENIKVTMDDFLNALHEIIPAFGASINDLDRCRLNGIVEFGGRHAHIFRSTMLLAEQAKVSRGSPLVTCLLEGPSGSGKTAMASTVGINSNFPYVKIVFEDAYKSPLSIVILEDIERLLEYVAIGPRFSNLISQTLMVLLKRLPPKVLEQLNVFSEEDIDTAAEALNDVPIKKMYMVLEMAAQRE
ncbi:hypothetical protein AgCh_007427 [Apium graveolens]